MKNDLSILNKSKSSIYLYFLLIAFVLCMLIFSCRRSPEPVIIGDYYQTTKKSGVGYCCADCGPAPEIWEKNCASCHWLEKNKVGPPLGRIDEERKYAWYEQFVRDERSLLDSGDSVAIHMNKLWGDTYNHQFDTLSASSLQIIWSYCTN